MPLYSGKTYYAGKPENYTSMYGYPKRRFPIYVVGESKTCPVGSVKEERVIGPKGETVSLMFYERNGWRANGKQRFFDSIESLIRSNGGQFSICGDIVKDPATESNRKPAVPVSERVAATVKKLSPEKERAAKAKAKAKEKAEKDRAKAKAAKAREQAKAKAAREKAKAKKRA